MKLRPAHIYLLPIENLTTMFTLFDSRLRSKFLQLLACVLLLTIATGASAANTLVRVTTPLGGFTLELFDDIAPVTVTNFLNYVRSGRYNGTVIHRTEPAFVIQGGWVSFSESEQNFSILAADTTIVNEFSVSNTRGTIAMAKVAGDPDSATTQWFINVGENAANLDGQNGGFTAFGRVLDGGMAVVDAINALNRYNLTAGLETTPLINFTALPLTSANLVTVSMSVIENLSANPNVFNSSSNILNTRVNAGELGLLSLAFSVYSFSPETQIQAISASVRSLGSAQAKMATFDTSSNLLTIPELFLGGSIAYRNVVFELTDPAQLIFTLRSAE